MEDNTNADYMNVKRVCMQRPLTKKIQVNIIIRILKVMY